MSTFTDSDILKLQALLKRSGEFIAYFEVSEQKMQSWREGLEAKEKQQDLQIQKQFESMNNMLQEIESLFSQAGIARFNLHMDALEQSHQQQLKAIHAAERKLFLKASTFERYLQSREAQALEKIESLTLESLKTLSSKANHIVSKSHQSMPSKRFTARLFLPSLVGALCVGFGMSLYLTDEMPWEIHKHAKAERVAGQLLQKAWPRLTDEEKNKILVENDEGQPLLQNQVPNGERG